MTTSSDSTSPAMALLEKYSTMNRGIDEARRQTAQIKQDTESKRAQIQKLDTERDEMTRQIQQARAESQQFSSEIAETMRRSSKVEQYLSKATSELDRVQRQHDVVARFIQEERRSFLDTCRDFRTSLKRTRLDASETDDETIMVRAFLEIHNANEDDNEEELGDEMEGRDDDSEVSKEISGTTSNAGDKRLRGDNARNTNHRSSATKNNKNKTSDVEMEQALELMHRSMEQEEQASIALERALAQKEAAKERSNARAKQMEHQQGQLERIQKDISEMESQLTDLLRETRRAQEMGENFEKDAARRRQRANHGTGSNQRFTPLPAPTSMSQHPVTPSPYASGGSSRSRQPRNPYAAIQNRTTVPSNPYTQRDGGGTNPTSGGVSSTRRKHMERDNYNSLELQHPHRAGRIRVDRQFSTALEIMCTREDESSPQGAAAHRYQNPEHRSGLADTSDDDSPQDTGLSNSSNQISPLKKKTSLLDTLNELDDSDENDDELLSYVAFSTSKK